jgi:hypothetical protein
MLISDLKQKSDKKLTKKDNPEKLVFQTKPGVHDTAQECDERMWKLLFHDVVN